MTDEIPQTPEEKNDLVYLNEQGDPNQDTGTRMIEIESYQRVVDGFRIAAEACAHLGRHEFEAADHWRRLMVNFDQYRMAAIQQAGIEDTIRSKPTEAVRGQPMDWREARDRLYQGIKQACGGARQLAVCFRGDLVFARMAADLDTMEAKLRKRAAKRTATLSRHGLVWMPGDP